MKLDELLEKNGIVHTQPSSGWVKLTGNLAGSWAEFAKYVRQHFNLDEEDEQLQSEGREDLLRLANTLALEILGYEPLPALKALPQLSWSALFWAKMEELNGFLSQAEALASRWDTGVFSDGDELWVENILNGLEILSYDISRIRAELDELGLSEPVDVQNPLLLAIFIEAGIASSQFPEEFVFDLPEVKPEDFLAISDEEEEAADTDTDSSTDSDGDEEETDRPRERKTKETG